MFPQESAFAKILILCTDANLLIILDKFAPLYDFVTRRPAACRIRAMQCWNTMDWMEIFTLVTGLIYVVLEIRQKNFMWVVGMLTSAATVYVFFRQGLYASSVLNIYYFAIAFWGLYRWRKDSKKLQEDQGGQGSDDIHLSVLPGRVIWGSTAVFLLGTAALVFIMDLAGDSMSLADASVAMLSAVATWWLGRSYLHQWALWIAADILTALMCFSQGLYLMTVLYAAYTLFAVYGYYYWYRNGRFV